VNRTVQTSGADPSCAVVSVPKPHRCGKDDLKPLPTENQGRLRRMQCATCKDIWCIEYRNQRVLNIYRNGVRQEV
jgi:hypothetical protein